MGTEEDTEARYLMEWHREQFRTQLIEREKDITDWHGRESVRERESL